MSLATVLDDWELEIDGQTMLRPSTIQNRLLEVHDHVDGDVRAAVETWLGGSVDRHMYSADEVNDMIAALREQSEDPVPVP